MSVVTGLSNSLLLAIINHAATIIAKSEATTQYFFMYFVVLVLFLYAQWFSMSEAISLIEEAVANLRMRLSNKLRHVDLSFYERKSVNILYNRLTGDNSALSSAIPQITVALQFSTLVVFSLVYMAFISPISFFITVFGIICGYFYFFMLSKKIKKSTVEIINYETHYFGSLSSLLNGFKEIKINQTKSESLYKTLVNNAIKARDMKISLGKMQVRTMGAGRVVICTIIPILIFIVPLYSNEQTINIFKITATMLFIYGPVTVLFDVIPLITEVNALLDYIYNLEKEIDEAIHQGQRHSEVSYAEFKEIHINNLAFSYPKQKKSDAFSIGPIAEKISAGELIFIIGGNGSGKSTFLKLLVGLYYPTEGGIYVDETLIDDDSYQDYRELFSIIFTDFYLFDQLYGIEGIDDEKVNYWLKKMQMNTITSFKEGRFTNTDLSTGQRKRLAFIAAILEDKPILILDEFAADQDPVFRKYFYEVILKELKLMGKTVIAVTHDDHYFHVPDRVLKMDSGSLLKFSLDK
jgi:putative ATP-binding cassette transporter